MLFLINCWSSVVCLGCVATVCAISTFFFFFCGFENKEKQLKHDKTAFQSKNKKESVRRMCLSCTHILYKKKEQVIAFQGQERPFLMQKKKKKKGVMGFALIHL